MTKNEISMALDAMLEQGNQLRASELIPALTKIMDLIPESTGGGGIPVVEIELPTIGQLSDLAARPARFEIPPQKVEILKTNPFVILNAKSGEGELQEILGGFYFKASETREQWYKLYYDKSSYDNVTPLVLGISWNEYDGAILNLVKNQLCINSTVTNEEADGTFVGHIVPTTLAIYKAINKTE